MITFDTRGVRGTVTKDKSIISTLNSTQSRFAEDGYRFYEFINDGILHTRDINREVNSNWLFTMKINNRRLIIKLIIFMLARSLESWYSIGMESSAGIFLDE